MVVLAQSSYVSKFLRPSAWVCESLVGWVINRSGRAWWDNYGDSHNSSSVVAYGCLSIQKIHFDVKHISSLQKVSTTKNEFTGDCTFDLVHRIVEEGGGFGINWSGLARARMRLVIGTRATIAPVFPPNNHKTGGSPFVPRLALR